MIKKGAQSKDISDTQYFESLVYKDNEDEK